MRRVSSAPSLQQCSETSRVVAANVAPVPVPSNSLSTAPTLARGWKSAGSLQSLRTFARVTCPRTCQNSPSHRRVALRGGTTVTSAMLPGVDPSVLNPPDSPLTYLSEQAPSMLMESSLSSKGLLAAECFISYGIMENGQSPDIRIGNSHAIQELDEKAKDFAVCMATPAMEEDLNLGERVSAHLRKIVVENEFQTRLRYVQELCRRASASDEECEGEDCPIPGRKKRKPLFEMLAIPEGLFGTPPTAPNTTDSIACPETIEMLREAFGTCCKKHMLHIDVPQASRDGALVEAYDMAEPDKELFKVSVCGSVLGSMDVHADALLEDVLRD